MQMEPQTKIHTHRHTQNSNTKHWCAAPPLAYPAQNLSFCKYSSISDLFELCLPSTVGEKLMPSLSWRGKALSLGISSGTMALGWPSATAAARQTCFILGPPSGCSWAHIQRRWGVETETGHLIDANAGCTEMHEYSIMDANLWLINCLSWLNDCLTSRDFSKYLHFKMKRKEEKL